MRKFAYLLLLLSPISALAQRLPRPDHIVIVIEENRHFSQIIGNREAPYINALAKRGTLFTQSYGVTHPSLPNYLALFSGSLQGVGDNSCPLELTGGNLASSLLEKGYTFASYAESLPEAGSEVCSHMAYKRKHNAVANWKSLAQYNLPFSAFPQDFNKLSTVSLVIPDQMEDMHDGSIARGDFWLREHIEPYARWAMKHNSLLILTWDEDDGSDDNRIATIFVGAMVKRGNSAQRIDHYNVLRTIEEMYGLPYLGESVQADAISSVWQRGTHEKKEAQRNQSPQPK